MPARLGGRQLDVMQILWERGEATVADVQAAFDGESPLAYTTVATLLGRLEKKGLVTHRSEGRTYFYRPAVSRGRLGRSMVGEVLDDVFDGSPTQLVSQLLESDRVDAGELARIKELIARHEAANPEPKERRRAR